MPLPALTPDEKLDAAKGVESDLKWLLSDSGVEDDVQTALDIMRENGIRRLPVINDQGTLAGIVSSGDIIATANSAENAELPFYRTEGMLKAVAGNHTSTPLQG